MPSVFQQRIWGYTKHRDGPTLSQDTVCYGEYRWQLPRGMGKHEATQSRPQYQGDRDMQPQQEPPYLLRVHQS